MAYNVISASPGERLSRIRNWEARGLLYWLSRELRCQHRVSNADSGTQLRRAVTDLSVAQEALRRFREEAAR